MKRKINSKLTHGGFPLRGRRARGFTLIELLVVVLIIGILAAIALPQYQKAVLKSRFSSLMATAKALRDGNEAYYLTHSRYATAANDLDVTVTSNTDSSFTFSGDTNYAYVLATRPDLKNNYIMYQKQSKYFPDEIHCEAETGNTQAEWLCKESLKGREIGGSITSGYTTYVLQGSGTDSFASRSFTELTDAAQCTTNICKYLFSFAEMMAGFYEEPVWKITESSEGNLAGCGRDIVSGHSACVMYDPTTGTGNYIEARDGVIVFGISNVAQTLGDLTDDQINELLNPRAETVSDLGLDGQNIADLYPDLWP